MARYTDAVCRLCRREGVKLYLKGDKCYSDKCPVVKRNTPPGQHGLSRRKVSEYGVQLREKQKARRFYGVLETQFERYFDLAARKKGVTGEILLQILERRLDNVIYRMGFAASRSEARQIVKHSHIEVNGRKVNIPSYLCREGEVIALRHDHKRAKELIANTAVTIPAWLTVEAEAMRGTVVRLPNRDEIDAPVQEHLIVELYSR
ncbi:MAG TPA: 30S ribosomal protein S4 [Symbiobacteriaceae bacterium]|jgi:small subunit ribosomal protein S4